MTGLVGNPGALSDASTKTLRLGREGALITSDGSPRYHEYTSRGAVFSASNAAGQVGTPSTLLGTTYVGLCVQNPAGTAKSLSIINYSVCSNGSVSGAVGGVAIGGTGSAAGVTTHTTPLAALWGTNLLGPLPVGVASAGSAPGSIALVDSACTLVGTPRVIQEVTGGLLTTVPNPLGANVDVAGSIVVAPGGCVFSVFLIASMTNLVSSFIWAEISS